MRPLFSIIVPVYNAQTTLKRCLDSILNQVFIYFEVICIDDGSTDSSWSILSEYSLGDSRIRCLSQSNSGPSAARNKGIDESLGDYTIFVDSDDYLFTNKALTILAEKINSQSECDLIYYAGAIASSDSIYPDDSKHNRVYTSGLDCMENNCLNSHGMVFGNMGVFCCKSNVLKEHNIRFSEEIHYGEDRLFVCTLFYHAKKTIVIHDVLYCYIVDNSSSLMNDNTRRVRGSSDNRIVAKQLDLLVKDSASILPNFRKYIHGLYVQNAQQCKRNEIDWGLVFRNCPSIKLFVKDILMYLGLFHY